MEPQGTPKSRSDARLGCLTDVGVTRTVNQDAFGYYEPEDPERFGKKGRLVIVCDGMGGHKGGEVASRLATEAIVEAFKNSDDPDLANVLTTAFQHANRAVYEKAQADSQLQGMGCTGVGLIQRGAEICLAHVGDSRAYLLQEHKIQLLTKDHSLVQQMVDEGLLDPADMEKHPDRNVILRSLGVAPDVDVEITRHRAQPDDIYLLCSDGLSGLVTKEEMALTVYRNRDDLQLACRELVNRANARGGPDNITACLLHVVSVPENQQSTEGNNAVPQQGHPNSNQAQQVAQQAEQPAPQSPKAGQNPPPLPPDAYQQQQASPPEPPPLPPENPQ